MIHALATIAAVLAACSGTSSSAGSGGAFGEVDPTGPDGIGPPPELPQGPEAEPCSSFASAASGSEVCSSFPPPAIVCEGGSDPRVGCASAYRCTAGAFVPVLVLETPRCEPLECPTEASIVEGTACNVVAYDAGADGGGTTFVSAPRICSYPKRTCACQGPSGASIWVCTTPRIGCPIERPRLGSPCVNPEVCDYGACLFGGARVSCTAGPPSFGGGNRWAQVTAVCDGGT